MLFIKKELYLSGKFWIPSLYAANHLPFYGRNLLNGNYIYKLLIQFLIWTVRFRLILQFISLLLIMQNHILVLKMWFTTEKSPAVFSRNSAALSKKLTLDVSAGGIESGFAFKISPPGLSFFPIFPPA